MDESQYMNAMLAGYMFGIIGNTLSSGLARPYCCYWNLQTDEFRLLDSGCLYDLLEKYPDLYENYLAERSRTGEKRSKTISSNTWSGKNRNC